MMTKTEIQQLANELGDSNPNYEFYRTHTREEIVEAVEATREEEVKCTPGHEAQCRNAHGENCECDCGGRNHGRDRQDN